MPLDTHQSSDSAQSANKPAPAWPFPKLGFAVGSALGSASQVRAAVTTGLSQGSARLHAVSAPLVAKVLETGADVHQHFRPWLKAPSQWWWFTGSLTRRIFTANFVGLIVLLLGFGVLTYQHTWLIDAKSESLRTQARMIAVAIASNAKMETQSIVIDPDRVSEIDRSTPSLNDESLQPIALEIQPERIGPIVRKLIETGDVRVRVYNRESVKLVDSDGMVAAKQIQRLPLPIGPNDSAVPDEPAESLSNAWTKFIGWMMRSPLQVYREIGAGSKVTDYPEVKQALGGEVTSVLLLSNKGEQIISVFAPVQRMKSIPAFVWLTTRPGDLDHILWRERRPFFVFSIVALIATMIASIMLRRTIGGPMRELATAAEHVSRNINARHEIPELQDRRDEVGEMARAYRKMTAALYRRIEASDRFAQDVAHELKNPVAAARATAESMTYAKTDSKRDELVRLIQGELKRLNRLISDVSNASRLDAELALQETEPVDVAIVADNITGVFRDIQAGRDDEPCRVDFTREPEGAKPGTFVIDGHEGRLGQVVTNLVDNALSFSPPGGCVAVTVIAEAGDIVIRVDDDGPGIPENKLDDVFKRFYSDRPQSDRISAKNSGLGLSISREIVEAHGGTITAQNRTAEPGALSSAHERPELAGRRIPGVAGARFEVRLPHVDAIVGKPATRLGFKLAK